MKQDLAQTLESAAARKGGPIFYLDGNILVDIVRPKRHPSSLDFLEECLVRSWRRVTSTFAVMEALDVEQDNRWAGIEFRRGESFDTIWRRRQERKLAPRVHREIRNNVTRALDGLVEQFQPNTNMWEDAIRVAIHTASFAPDCIHVAAARSLDCDVLVTRDSQLQHAAADEIQVASPEKLIAQFQAAR